MKKTLLLVVGLLLGFMFAEIVRRKKMERLQELEAKEVNRKKQTA